MNENKTLGSKTNNYTCRASSIFFFFYLSVRNIYVVCFVLFLSSFYSFFCKTWSAIIKSCNLKMLNGKTVAFQTIIYLLITSICFNYMRSNSTKNQQEIYANQKIFLDLPMCVRCIFLFVLLFYFYFFFQLPIIILKILQFSVKLISGSI